MAHGKDLAPSIGASAMYHSETKGLWSGAPLDANIKTFEDELLVEYELRLGDCLL